MNGTKNLSAADKAGQELLGVRSVTRGLGFANTSKADTFESSKKKNEKLTDWQKFKIKFKKALPFIGIGAGVGVIGVGIKKLVKGIGKLFKHKK